MTTIEHGKYLGCELRDIPSAELPFVYRTIPGWDLDTRAAIAAESRRRADRRERRRERLEERYRRSSRRAW